MKKRDMELVAAMRKLRGFNAHKQFKVVSHGWYGKAVFVRHFIEWHFYCTVTDLKKQYAAGANQRAS